MVSLFELVAFIMRDSVVIRLHAILPILLWEFSRRGWWKLLLTQAAVLGLATIVFASLARNGPIDAASGRTLHMIFVGIVLVAAGGTAMGIQGASQRFYLLPLSNGLLAAVCLLPGMICVVGNWMLFSAALNHLFELDWPVSGPALFMAGFWGAIQTVSHAARFHRIIQFGAWVAVSVLLGTVLCHRYGGGGLLNPKSMWATVTAGDILFWGGLIAAEYLLMRIVIARARCGSELRFGIAWPGPRTHSRPPIVIRGRFRNAASAQFWFEWRQKGWILPSTLVAFVVLLLGGYFCRMYVNGEYELLHSGIGYGIGLVPVSAVLGIVLGHVDLLKKDVECGAFLGTRPATDLQLAAALLKVEAVSLLVTWALWCCGLIAATGVLWASQGVGPVLDLWTDHGRFADEFAATGGAFCVVLVAIALMLSWIAMSLATSLVLAGRRQWQIGGAVTMIVLLLAIVASAGADDLSSASADSYQVTIRILGGMFAVTACAIARRRNLIDQHVLRAWLTILAAGVCLSIAVLFQVGWWNVARMFQATGLIALSMGSWVAAPLAFSWNRHR